MQIVKINGKSYAVSLDWHLLQNGGPVKQELAALCKEMRTNYGCRVSLTIDNEVLDVVGLSDKPTKSNVIPAAAILSEANRVYLLDNPSETQSPDWMIVEKIDATDYWLCAVKDGLPAPGMDIVGNYDYVTSKIADILDVGSFTVFSTDDNIREYVGEMYATENKDFSSLISGVKSKHKIVQLSGYPVMLIGAGLGGLLVLGGLFFGYSLWQDNEVKLKKAALARQQQQQIQAALENKEISDKAIKESIDKARQAKKVEILTKLNGFSPFNNNVASSIGNAQIRYNGWTLTDINCMVESNSCTYALKRELYGTNNSLLQALPSAQITGDDASYSVVFPVMTIAEKDLVDNVASSVGFADEFISYMQSLYILGIRYQYNLSATEVKVQVQAAAQPETAPVEGQPPAVPTINEIGTGYMMGGMQAQGVGLSSYSELVNVFGNSGSVVIKSVSYKVEADSWQIDGEYYTK